jgi:hypothetical protein
MKTSLRRASLVCVVLLALPGMALAQMSGGMGGPGGGGGGGGRHGGGRRQQGGNTGSQAQLPALKPHPDPTQRLDTGALLCGTEAELKQHQAAVLARLSGGSAPEPTGCHIVQGMVAVSVIGRDGPASTQVRLPDRVGWTDSIVRDRGTPGA